PSTNPSPATSPDGTSPARPARNALSSPPRQTSQTGAPATSRHAPPPQPPPSPLDDAARRFADAAAHEASDPQASLAVYARLAAGDGPWAANALYAAARLRYDRRDDTTARALLTEYLRRFPHGGNAADARALLERLKGASR